jgi:hypothetical protein
MKLEQSVETLRRGLQNAVNAPVSGTWCDDAMKILAETEAK